MRRSALQRICHRTSQRPREGGGARPRSARRQSSSVACCLRRAAQNSLEVPAREQEVAAPAVAADAGPASACVAVDAVADLLVPEETAALVAVSVDLDPNCPAAGLELLPDRRTLGERIGALAQRSGRDRSVI